MESAGVAQVGLFELVMGLMDHLKSYISKVAEDYGISLTQAHILWLLQPGQPLAMGAVADLMRCDPSNVTGIVDRLEVSQLVERHPGPADRRVKTLILTDKGERIRGEIIERVENELPMTNRLSSGQREQLKQLLQTALTT